MLPQSLLIYYTYHDLSQSVAQLLSLKCIAYCNTSTTLSAECPSDVVITPDKQQFTVGDELTCNATGYELTYMWTGTVNGVNVVAHTGSSYTLVEGDFDLTCTATVSQLMCTGTASNTATGTVLPTGV